MMEHHQISGDPTDRINVLLVISLENNVSISVLSLLCTLILCGLIDVSVQCNIMYYNIMFFFVMYFNIM